METKGVLEKFMIPEGYEVYNPTAPFNYNSREILAARVEPVANQFASTVKFFAKNQDGIWKQDITLPEFEMQDPFITKVGEEYVFGGVQVVLDPANKILLEYATVLYYGKSLESLNFLYKSQPRMKGIRLLELQNGKIGLFTRPQVVSEKDPLGRGRIAFTFIDNLHQIAEGVEKAEIIDGLYGEKEWGGSNEVYELENGSIGVLGHKAHYDETNFKHYYIKVFEFNPITKEVITYKIVLKRDAFPPEVRSVETDLYDILYS